MSRSELDRPTFSPGQLQEREMSDLYGFDDTNSVWRRVLVDTTGRLIVVGGGGGGGVGITDTDDNSLAAGQTTLLAICEGYVYDGTSWIRHYGGVDNAVAPASPQGALIGGVVTDPLDTYVDGDISLLHFDLLGRLVVATQGSPGATIATSADTAVGIGATVPLPAIPAGTRRMTIQNTGPSGTFIRVREVGGGAGSGIILGRFSTITYGGEDGALDPIEAQDVSLAVGGVAVATTVAIQFEAA